MNSTLIANQIGLKEYLKGKGFFMDENYDLIQVAECFEQLNMDGDQGCIGLNMDGDQGIQLTNFSFQEQRNHDLFSLT